MGWLGDPAWWRPVHPWHHGPRACHESWQKVSRTYKLLYVTINPDRRSVEFTNSFMWPWILTEGQSNLQIPVCDHESWQKVSRIYKFLYVTMNPDRRSVEFTNSCMWPWILTEGQLNSQLTPLKLLSVAMNPYRGLVELLMKTFLSYCGHGSWQKVSGTSSRHLLDQGGHASWWLHSRSCDHRKIKRSIMKT